MRRVEGLSQSLVPAMSQYRHDPDVDVDAGPAEHPGSLSFSTSAASQKKVPQEFDISSEVSGSEESINNSEYIFLHIGRNFLSFLIFRIPFNPRRVKWI